MRFFHPFEGDDYGKQAPSNKVLIVGESHYEEVGYPSCDAETTKNAVHTHRYVSSLKYFQYVEQIANAVIERSEPKDIWPSVCFTNFVQEPVSAVDTRPQKSEICAGLEPFWKTVDEVDPSVILVFSRLVWTALPDVCPDGVEADTGRIGESSWTWRYARRSRPPLYAICFPHQSMRGNPPVEVWQAWARHAMELITKARAAASLSDKPARS